MIDPPYKIFETERLFLRPVEEKDAAFLIKILNSEKWLLNIGDRNVHTIEVAKKYIEERITTQYQKLGFGNYLVSAKETGAEMGVCGLYARPGLDTIDIGFAFFPEYENQGFGFEAASILIQAAKEDFHLQKLCAITIPSNIASQKLINKLGLEYLKTIKIDGDNEELMYYEIDL